MVPAFHFRVSFGGIPSTEADSLFESVAGIQGIFQQTDTTIHGSVVFQPLVLRRPVVPMQQSALLQWIFRSLRQEVAALLPELSVEVLDEAHQPAITIILKQISVRSWALDELHARRSGLLMEEIQLQYKSIEIN